MVYDKKYHEDMHSAAVHSARVIVPIVQNLIKAKSVCDVGCGDGTWLADFIKNGATRVLGVDGPWVEMGSLRIPSDAFYPWNLEQPLRIDHSFDLVISLEVAEHLSPARAESFIGDLCSLAPIALFSAAIPQQGGTNHTNERWPNYWSALFAKHRRRPVDLIRWQVWEDDRVAWYYQQNILLYFSEDIFFEHFRHKNGAEKDIFAAKNVVHPMCYLQHSWISNPGLRKLLGMLPGVLRRAVSRQMSVFFGQKF